MAPSRPPESASSHRPSAHSGSAWLIASRLPEVRESRCASALAVARRADLGGEFVLARPLEQMGLVDRRVQRHVAGAPLFGHGAGRRDQGQRIAA